MLRKTPKTLDAVDMISGTLVDQSFDVAHGMVLAQPFERVVTSEGVGIVDRPLSGFLSYDGHELFFGYMLHDPCIDLAIAFQKAKYNVFAGGTPSALALAPAAKVAFIHLYIAIQSATFKLGDMVDRFAQTLVDTRDRLVVEAKVMRETVCRLLLIESLHDRNFRTNPFQRFLFSTAFVSTSDVSAACLRDPERTAEYTLSASQKVGRTTENVLLSCNHKGILTPCGYETH